MSIERLVQSADALYLKVPHRTAFAVLFFLGVYAMMLVGNDWTPYDFSLFYASGQAFLDGNPPYEPGAVPELDIEPHINRNPPIWLLLFAPLTQLSFWTAHAVMVAGVVVAYALNAVLLLRNGLASFRQPLTVLWLAALTGFWRALGQAQTHVLLALVVTGAYFNLYRRPILAGVLVGFLASSKPNYVIWPLFLFLAGGLRILVASAITAALVVAASFAIGPELPFDYVESMQGVEAAPIAMNSSLASQIAKYGITGLEVPIAALIVLPLAVLVWRSRASLEDASGLALAAAPLASPLAWPAYSLFLLPVLFSRRWHHPELLAAGLLVIPLSPLPIFRELTGTACCAAYITVIAIIAVPLLRARLNADHAAFDLLRGGSVLRCGADHDPAPAASRDGGTGQGDRGARTA